MTGTRNGPSLLRALGIGLYVLFIALCLLGNLSGVPYAVLGVTAIGLILGADLWKVWLEKRTWRAVLGQVVMLVVATFLMWWFIDR